MVASLLVLSVALTAPGKASEDEYESLLQLKTFNDAKSLATNRTGGSAEQVPFSERVDELRNGPLDPCPGRSGFPCTESGKECKRVVCSTCSGHNNPAGAGFSCSLNPSMWSTDGQKHAHCEDWDGNMQRIVLCPNAETKQGYLDGNLRTQENKFEMASREECGYYCGRTHNSRYYSFYEPSKLCKCGLEKSWYCRDSQNEAEGGCVWQKLGRDNFRPDWGASKNLAGDLDPNSHGNKDLPGFKLNEPMAGFGGFEQKGDAPCGDTTRWCTFEFRMADGTPPTPTTAAPTMTMAPTMTPLPTPAIPMGKKKKGTSTASIAMGAGIGGAAGFVLLAGVGALMYKELQKKKAPAAAAGDAEAPAIEIANPGAAALGYDVRDDIVDSDLIEVEAQDRAFALGEVMEA